MIIDAKGKKVGRLASHIALVLRSKNMPSFEPQKKPTQKVTVINAAHMDVLISRLAKDRYVRYSGYPGGKREQSRAEVFENLSAGGPAEVLRRAVKGMLPKNKLQSICMKNLTIYNNEEHGKKSSKEK